MHRLSAAVAACALVVLVAAGIVGATALQKHARAAAQTGASASPTDPLDPLTADELQTTFTVIEQSKRLAAGTFFPIVKLDEPAKSDASLTPPCQVPLRAFTERHV